MKLGPWQRLGLFFALFCCGLLVYWALQGSGMLGKLQDGDTLRAAIVELGVIGPFIVIGSMVIAILVSPIPSAPIALAAGAAYGHIWGTVFVLIGAELGAIAAFMMSRLLGYDAVRALIKGDLPSRAFYSQNTLMGIVFLSRLLPFISFDVISYAAGLTILSFWRFFIATLLGIAPASFLLAHFGSELASSEMERITFAVLVLGLLTGVPLLVRTVLHQRG